MGKATVVNYLLYQLSLSLHCFFERYFITQCNSGVTCCTYAKRAFSGALFHRFKFILKTNTSTVSCPRKWCVSGISCSHNYKNKFEKKKSGKKEVACFFPGIYCLTENQVDPKKVSPLGQSPTFASSSNAFWDSMGSCPFFLNYSFVAAPLVVLTSVKVSL